MADYKFDTIQLHAGQERPDPATDARAVPIYATTSYVFHDCADAAARFGLQAEGNIYGRLTNSTQEVFEKRIAALEGGSAALAVASGAAAITYTLQALAQNGGHIVSQKTIYGGSYNLLAHTLPNLGITASFVDIHDLEAVERAITEQTKALYIETLGNPNCDIPDMDALAELAHKYQIPLVVDNTFGTPYWIRPIEHGADIVVHSATKFIGGHGTTLGGVIVDSGRFDWKASGKYPAITDPNDSYHGVVFSQAAPGAAFVTYIRAVILRDMFTFEIKGGIKEAHEFIDHLEIFSLLANVADVKSLVIHPATTTHSQLNAQELQEQGIRQNTIRLSIGTEHIDDIIADLEKGFASVEKL